MGPPHTLVPADRTGPPTWPIVLGLALAGAAAGALLVALLGLALSALPASGAAATDPLLAGLGADLTPASEALVLAGEDQDMRTSVLPTVEKIVVDVAGAVVHPGLHRLLAGDRVGDAIEAAGGFAPRADLAAAGQALNLAEPLIDGAKVLVPELGQARRAPAAADDGRIDLNQADQALLESLPGIGPVTATKIMAARAEQPFASVDELRARGLVGASVYEQVKDLVSVR